jgi:hypothetical protein
MSGPELKHDYCRRCGKPITISWEPADTLEQAAKPATEQAWACPHGCGLMERSHLRGRILNVWGGHLEDPPPR